MPTSAVVLFATGFEEIEAVTPVDVLRRAGVTVTLVGVEGTTITGANGLTVSCDMTLADYADTPDAVILPGGLPGAENLGQSAAVQTLVETVHQRGGVCAAICAAPALTLAKYGLLSGKTATCYPAFEKKFSADTTHSEERVVVDGTIVTSRAPGTALAFSIQLAEILVGKETADELRAGMLV